MVHIVVMGDIDKENTWLLNKQIVITRNSCKDYSPSSHIFCRGEMLCMNYVCYCFLWHLFFAVYVTFSTSDDFFQVFFFKRHEKKHLKKYIVFIF